MISKATIEYFRRVTLACGQALFLLILWSNTCLADGVGFNRPGQVSPILGFRSLIASNSQEVFIYLNSGERISLDSQKSFEEAAGTAQPLNVQIYSPSGLYHNYTVGASGMALNSYLSAPVTEAGIYTIRLNGANRKSYWRYDINALPSGGSSYLDRVSGRVFTEVLILGQLTGTVDFQLFHLNQLGHQYSSNWYGFNGIDSRIVTNIFGVSDNASCTPLYESQDIDYNAASLDCGRNYKQFFTSPDPALPATSSRWNGSTSASDWLRPVLATPAVTIGTPVFSPSPSVATPGQGTFTIPISGFTEIATLLIDVDGNNVYTDGVDRAIPFLAGNSIFYDGLDGLGQAVPCGKILNAKVLIDKGSEIHFVLSDVERIGGLRVIRQNGLNAPNATLYWDDTNLQTVNAPTDPAPANRDGRAGVNSDVSGGVHGWVQPAAGPNFSWGNDRAIDNWATFPIANVERIFPFSTASCPPLASDDNSLNNSTGTVVTLGILSNDLLGDGTAATPSATTVTLTTTGLPAGSTVSFNTLTVTGEGSYQYDPATGNLSFTPQPGFTANPTPITYILTETATGLTDPALVTITYENAMPVTLVAFKAVLTENRVHLTWSTTEESNSDYFQIERSSDGKHWQAIGIERASRESQVFVRYDYWDNQPLAARSYYRLKMVDLDQTFAYSGIRYAGELAGGERPFVYPVPAVDEVFLSNIDIADIKEWSISGVTGMVIKSGKALSAPVIDLKGVPAGLYMLRITSVNGVIYTKKVIVSGKY